MRIKRSKQGWTRLWLSPTDTYNWAHKSEAAWPCSVLSGHRVYAEFDNGDLIDMRIDGRYRDCPADEFNAITEDYLKGYEED